MAEIRVDLKSELLNGMSVIFKAPCDCTEITGLVAYYHNGNTVKNKSFTFKDAHGNNVAGLGNLFGEGAYVKVVLDTKNGFAYIQNADTNAYLEGRFDAIEMSLSDVPVPVLLSDWVAEEDGTYVQNISMVGLGAVSMPIVALSSVSEIASEDELYSYACISDVVITDGNIKFIASELPTVSFTVVVKGVVSSGEVKVSDITALVTRISELEEENAELNSKLPKVLWENSEKLTKFEPQTISLNDEILNYDMIKVSFTNPYWQNPTSIEIYTDTLDASSNFSCHESRYDNGVYLCMRSVIPNTSDNTIAFANATQNGVINNERCIPSIVLGYKF